MTIEDLIERTTQLILDIRSAVEATGRTGRVPHALNVAATEAQCALGALYVAQAGGSPGISAPAPRN